MKPSIFELLSLFLDKNTFLMNLKDNITDLRNNIIKLIEAKFELGKLEIQDKIEWIIVKVFYILLLAFLGLMVLIFINILIAIYLSEWLGNKYLGYIISLFLNVFFILLLVFRKDTIQNSIKHLIEKMVDGIMNQRNLKQ
jgi:hypothetical protein